MRICLGLLVCVLAVVVVGAEGDNRAFPPAVVDTPEFVQLKDDFAKAQFLVNALTQPTLKEKLLIRNLLWRYLNKHLHDKSKTLGDEIKKVIIFSVANKLCEPGDWIGLIKKLRRRKTLLSEIQQGKLIPDLETAASIMPCYYQLLNDLKARGYQFWSFRKYWQADKDKLPDKLLVIRHDIHFQDLASAYVAYVIEKGVLDSDDVATYYVMWGFPKEAGNAETQAQYLRLAAFLKKRSVDVQPHISPIDLYLEVFPEKQVKGEIPQLLTTFRANYRVKKEKDGIRYDIVGKDVLGLKHINAQLPVILRSYNQKWEKATGLAVDSYAVHGTTTGYAQIFKNFELLDQTQLLKQRIYQFDTYNTVIFNKLTYLSDNSRPYWIEFPEMIKDGRYELLMHPDVWWDKMVYD